MSIVRGTPATQIYGTGTTFKLTDTGDIDLGSSIYPSLITGDEKLIQDIVIILKSVMGSYDLDLLFGLDYTAIVESGFSIPIMKGKIITAVKSHPLVQDVTDIVFSPMDENRRLTVDMKVKLKSQNIITLGVTV